MTNNKWAAFVYARTYEMDFRLIAVPQDFKENGIKWALNHIIGTTQLPENLKKAPIWSLFRNKDYCIVGVTCMARDLIGQEMDVTKDSNKRPLYLFAGYAARLDEKHGAASIPPYTPGNLELFGLAYKYVEDKWRDKRSSSPVGTEYEDITRYLEHYSGRNLRLNDKPEQIRIFLDSEQNRHELWRAGAGFVGDPTSICLGLQSRKNIENSPFLNATQPGIAQTEEIRRHRADEEEGQRNPEKLTDQKDGDERTRKNREAKDSESVRLRLGLPEFLVEFFETGVEFFETGFQEFVQSISGNGDKSLREDEKTPLQNGTDNEDEGAPEKQGKYREPYRGYGLIPRKTETTEERPENPQRADSHKPKTNAWSPFSSPPRRSLRIQASCRIKSSYSKELGGTRSRRQRA